MKERKIAKKKNEHLDLVCRVIVANKDSDKSNKYEKFMRTEYEKLEQMSV